MLEKVTVSKFRFEIIEALENDIKGVNCPDVVYEGELPNRVVK